MFMSILPVCNIASYILNLLYMVSSLSLVLLLICLIFCIYVIVL